MGKFAYSEIHHVHFFPDICHVSFFFGDMHWSQLRRCANLRFFLVFRRCAVAPSHHLTWFSCFPWWPSSPATASNPFGRFSGSFCGAGVTDGRTSSSSSIDNVGIHLIVIINCCNVAMSKFFFSMIFSQNLDVLSSWRPGFFFPHTLTFVGFFAGQLETILLGLKDSSCCLSGGQHFFCSRLHP